MIPSLTCCQSAGTFYSSGASAVVFLYSFTSGLTQGLHPLHRYWFDGVFHPHFFDHVFVFFKHRGIHGGGDDGVGEVGDGVGDVGNGVGDGDGGSLLQTS